MFDGNHTTKDHQYVSLPPLLSSPLLFSSLLMSLILTSISDAASGTSWHKQVFIQSSFSSCSSFSFFFSFSFSSSISFSSASDSSLKLQDALSHDKRLFRSGIAVYGKNGILLLRLSTLLASFALASPSSPPPPFSLIPYPSLLPLLLYSYPPCAFSIDNPISGFWRLSEWQDRQDPWSISELQYREFNCSPSPPSSPKGMR